MSSADNRRYPSLRYVNLIQEIVIQRAASTNKSESHSLPVTSLRELNSRDRDSAGGLHEQDREPLADNCACAQTPAIVRSSLQRAAAASGALTAHVATSHGGSRKS
eukprot:TRINITY_DN8558_c0_g1_i10.p1 TRINITY_DN8558_c0_g1~~TRINITY_DN8558_c0_g1_i10.p1  ORF type:complete len:106 (-),score=5.16 TRINITY_DN8558_c0_g1_i10:14-331(-)